MANPRPPAGQAIPLPRKAQPEYRQKQRQLAQQKALTSQVTSPSISQAQAEKQAYLQAYGNTLGEKYYELAKVEERIANTKDPREAASLRASKAFIIRDIKTISKGPIKLQPKQTKTDFKKIEEPLIIGGEAIVGGYSSISGESVFITESGKRIVQTPANFEKIPASFNEPSFSPNVPKGTLPKSFVKNIETTRFEEVSTKPTQSTKAINEKLFSEEKTDELSRRRLLADISRGRAFDIDKEGYTPIGRFLIKDRAVYRGTEELQRRFERGLAIQMAREPKYLAGQQIIGAAGKSFFGGLKAIYDPTKTISEAGPAIVGAGQYLFKYEKIGGIQQIVPEKENISKLSEEFYSFAGTEKGQREIIGSLYGGAVFDAGAFGALKYLSRPAVNVSARVKNFARGVEVGVVEGTDNYNIIRRGNESFLLVPDIHPTLKSIPEVGDKPLTDLYKLTKANTGENVRGLTFVSGGLTTLKPGEKDLLRQIASHWKGIREAPFYSSPEATLTNSFTYKNLAGKNILVESGQKIAVGSKQFAENLVETGYKGYSLRLSRGRNVAFITDEPVSTIKRSNDIFEYRRRFFSPEQSGKAQIQASNEFLASIERQYGFQAQGVKYFRSRGSTIRRLKDVSPRGELVADIFNVKKIPFGLGERYPRIQELYEDIGFGREFKTLQFSYGKIGVPVGRPPSIDFEGEPIYKRYASRAVVEDPFSGKILLVQEKGRKLTFPGGGVEPVLVKGQGKSGVRLDYPKDFSQTALRELYEETGTVGFFPKKVRGKIVSETRALDPPVKAGGKTFPVFKFQDINTFYRVKGIPSYRAKGKDVARAIGLTPKKIVSSPDVDPVVKEFVRRNYFGKKPRKIIKGEPINTKELFPEMGQTIGFDLDNTLLSTTPTGKIILRKNIKQTLRELNSSGFQLKVFTHSKYKRADRLLKKTGLKKYFNEIISREKYAVGKSEDTLKNIERFKINLLVEDRPQQISSLRKKNLKAFQVPKDIKQPLSATNIIYSLRSRSDYYSFKRPVVLSDYAKPSSGRLLVGRKKPSEKDYSRTIESYSSKRFPSYYYPKSKERKPLVEKIERIGGRERFSLEYKKIERPIRPTERPRTPVENPYYYNGRFPERPPLRPPEKPPRYPTTYPIRGPTRVFFRTPKKQNIERKKEALGPGFLVALVKGYKVQKLASPKAFTLKEAIGFGERSVDAPIGRTFTLIPTGRAAPFRGLPGPSGKLRLSKKDPRFFVEKSRFAISTPLEKRTLRAGRERKRYLRRETFRGPRL